MLVYSIQDVIDDFKDELDVEIEAYEQMIKNINKK